MNQRSAAMPVDLKALRGEGVLEVTWGPLHIGRYGFVFLRGECGCAGCVDEHTGIRTLDLTTISPDITITDMQLVGNYAARIHWSDGHATGLYTWQRLYELCPCERCKPA